MVSVIIPVLNESETIRDIVEFARKSPLVREVIVVDDGSIDGTPEMAREAGARVITSTLLGKGASMEDGMLASKNEHLVYLDGDLRGLREDMIKALLAPMLDGKADFVKARFSRTAGRVTALTAKPLLRVFFPELAYIEQPLGGIIAAKRDILKRVRFENDYGVDVGLMLDVSAFGGRIAEVDIGHIEHDSHPLEVLGDMATQVVRVILQRASQYRRLSMSHIQEVAEVERRMQAELSVSLRRMGDVQRLALFDMDGTLLDGRFIVHLARRTNRTEELEVYLDNFSMTSVERVRRIGAMFRGVSREVFEDTARNIPLTEGAAETVIALRKRGYRVGIITDSFHIASETIRRRIFADFSVAHIMRFRKGKATGDIQLCPAMRHENGCTEHGYCKRNVMHHLMEKMNIDPTSVIAAGDGENDICMLKAAGLSVAFQPKNSSVQAAADIVVDANMTDLLHHLPNDDEEFPAVQPCKRMPTH